MNLLAIRDVVNRTINRTDVTTADIDTAVNSAIRRISKQLRVPPMETNLTLTALDDSGSLDLPPDFLEFLGLYLPDGTPCDRVTQTVLNTAQVHQGAIYCKVGVKLLVRPKPATGDTLTLYYYASPPPLALGTDENLYSIEYEDLLIAGSLARLTSVFVDSRKPLFEQEYLDFLVTAQEAGDAQQFSGRSWQQLPYAAEGSW